MQPAAAILALVLLGTAITTLRALRLAAFPGRVDYLLLMASGVWWTVSALLEVLASQQQLKIFYSELAWYGIITTPIFWMLFVTAYVRGADLPSASLHTGLAITGGLAVLGVAITNDMHHLVYTAVVPDPTPDFPDRQLYVHGPAFFGAMIAIYFFMALVTLRVIWATVHAPPFLRGQFIGLLLSATIPWAVNAAYNIGDLRPLGFDPTPLAFVVMPLIYNMLISRNRFLAVAPVALNAVVAAHPDGILVVSKAGLIVEANPAAREILGQDKLIGEPLAVFRGFGASTHASLFDRDEPTRQLRRDGRSYEVRVIEVDQGRGNECTAYVLRDITDFLTAQENLRISTRLMEERLDANLRLQEQLRDMAHRDSLTGLNNRRILGEIGERLIANADTVGLPLVAVSLDLDHFKRLNDTYGHTAGDEALVAVAAILSRSLRPGEVAIRMGGEEFLVLMPNADIESARARAEAWRALVRSLPLETGQGSVEITFSAGIAAYPDSAHSFEMLLQQADKSVYAAKRAGRNRVALARSPLGSLTADGLNASPAA